MQQNKDIKISNNFTKSLKWNNFRFRFVRRYFFTNTNVKLLDDPWKITTFIIPRNELWNANNQQMININSIELKQKCYIIMATNTYKKNSIWSDIQYFIRQTISTSKTQNLAPFLKLYKIMKVIIIKNLYPKLGIVNGTINYI
jgi:hypothetical protein